MSFTVSTTEHNSTFVFFGVLHPIQHFSNGHMSINDAKMNCSARACVLRAPPGSHRPVLTRTPGRTPFHPCAVLPRPASRTHPLPATPFQCPTITDGNARGRGPQHTFLPYVGPDCSLSRLRGGGVRPAGDPVDSDPRSRLRGTIPTLDQALVACWSLEFVATPGEPTVLSRVSCRPSHPEC